MNSYAAALSRAPAGPANAVDGTHYLLGTAEWGEFVARYSEADLIDVFAPGDRAALAAGKRVWHGRASWIDMIAATRAAAG